MTDNTPAAPQPLSESDERLYATIAHAGIIVFTWLAPLIMWLIGKDKSSYVDSQGKEALNFSILITIAYVVGWTLSIIFIGFIIVFAAWVVSLIFCIQAAMKTNKGEDYKYPFNWRLIK